MIQAQLRIPGIFGINIFARRNRAIPTAWSEITDSAQKLLFIRALSLLPFEQAIIEIARRILKLNKWQLRRTKTEDLTFLIEQLQWMHLQASANAIISQFTHDNIIYALPKDDFIGCTAFEFATADDYFKEWTDEPKDMKPLLKMVATLCRPIDKENLLNNGEAREVIQFKNAEFQIEKRAKKFETLDFSVIIIVLKYFEGVKKKVYEFGIQVGLFEIPLDEEESEFQKKNKSNNAVFGWWTVFRNIMKSQNRKEEEIWEMSLWRVLSIMIEEKQQSDELQKRMDSRN